MHNLQIPTVCMHNSSILHFNVLKKSCCTNDNSSIIDCQVPVLTQCSHE